MRSTKLIASVAMLAISAAVMAQRPIPIKSTSFNQDGSVIFRYVAPNAKAVELSGQFMEGNKAMTKDAEGVWSITVTPPQPDIYPYNFVVDGVSVSDPNNTLVFPNENFKASLLVMPDPDALYTINDVPHGKVDYRTYWSGTLNEYRPLLVYTPAEYEANPNKNYPVFYLISGTTDTEETWFKAGQANNILDNLIAQGKAEPMIVVMPYGYMNNGTPAPNTPEAADMYAVFANELTRNVMPYVESSYRTINDREHRAIAGFSRGGGQSMFTALSHPDKFGNLAIYSAYLTPEVMEKHFPNLKDDVNNLGLCWFCVGNSDFLYKDVMRNLEYFDNHGINYTRTPRDGAHTWMHARYCLAETAKNLFKKPDTIIGDVTIDNNTLDGFTIFRPTRLLETVASKGKLPVVVFGNGGCSHDSGYYVPMLKAMVDNGYLVIAVGESATDAAPGERHDFSTIGRDDHLIDAVDWACKVNADPQSEYYQMLDCFNIAVSGHSCGGAQAMAASYDPRITTTLMMNSGMGNMQMAGADSQSLLTLHNPILYLIGGPEDIAYGNAAIDYERINHVPVASANFPVGHGGTYGDDGGGVLGEVAIMWLDWQLKGKKDAARFFNNKAWRNKNYPQCTYESKNFK